MENDLKELLAEDVWRVVDDVEDLDTSNWSLIPMEDPDDPELNEITMGPKDIGSSIDFDFIIDDMMNKYFVRIVPVSTSKNYQQDGLQMSIDVGNILARFDYYIYLDTMDRDYNLVLSRSSREDLNNHDSTEEELIPEDITELLATPDEESINSNIVAKYI